jgi:hypothetical protein
MPQKQESKIHIPLSFEETISAVLKVKPAPKEKPAPKATAKRPGRKPITTRTK